jgi:hypothetical protein
MTKSQQSRRAHRARKLATAQDEAARFKDGKARRQMLYRLQMWTAPPCPDGSRLLT